MVNRNKFVLEKAVLGAVVYKNVRLAALNASYYEEKVFGLFKLILSLHPVLNECSLPVRALKSIFMTE